MKQHFRFINLINLKIQKNTMENKLFFICFLCCFNSLMAQNLKKDTLYDIDTENKLLSGDSLIYTISETSASYYKGNQNLGSFIKNNLVYPEQFKNQSLKEFVLIKFVIERSGKISNIKVLTKNNKKEFIEEAVRLINLVPKWIPATYDNKNIRAYLTIPFNFCPENCAGW